MHIVQPPSARYTTEDLGSSIRITVPSRKNWFAVAFLSFWLIAWAFGEIGGGGVIAAGLFRVLMGQALSTSAAGVGALSGVGLFILAWLGIWTTVGGFALYSWLWQVTGKEVIEMSGHSIIIRKVVLGFSRPKEYLAEHVKDLRASPMQMSAWGWPRGMDFWGLSGGTLAFDYGAKAFYFASGADEAEAKQIVAMIKGRFPALARVAGEDA